MKNLTAFAPCVAMYCTALSRCLLLSHSYTVDITRVKPVLLRLLAIIRSCGWSDSLTTSASLAPCVSMSCHCQHKKHHQLQVFVNALIWITSLSIHNNNKTITTRVLRPLYRTTCISWHLQLRTGGFCWCKVLLPAGGNRHIRIREKMLNFS